MFAHTNLIGLDSRIVLKLAFILDAMAAIVFQDPTQESPVRLLDVLLRHAGTAVEGGAAFAWASRSGIRKLIHDPHFEQFLERGRFHLIVGLDTTTDARALEALRAAEDQFPGLKLQMFVTPPEHGIFHPKLTWFRNKSGGIVVVGSGNLTERGLTESWEAFSELQIGEAEMVEVYRTWECWIEQQQPYLLPASSPAVAELAGANILDWSEERAKTSARLQRARNPRVLLCEIGKGRISKKGLQVDVGKNAFTQFFQVTSNRESVIFGLVESPDSVLSYTAKPIEKGSDNLCFEMQVPRYVYGARPIAIFLELRSGVFLYAIVRNGEAEYEELQAYLHENLPGKKESEMKRWSARVNAVNHFTVVKMLLAAVRHIT